jgi:hypothetical protein
MRPVRRVTESSLEILRSRLLATKLSARGLRERIGGDQDDVVGNYASTRPQRCSNCRSQSVGLRRLSCLGDDHKAIGCVLLLDPDAGAVAASDAGHVIHDPFQLLGIDVPTAHEQDVFETTRHEQPSRLDEAQVAGTQPT